MNSARKAVQALVAHARREGWFVDTERKAGHIGFFPPDAAEDPIFTGSTPSDWRAIRNLRAQLRRAGLRGLSRRRSRA